MSRFVFPLRLFVWTNVSVSGEPRIDYISMHGTLLCSYIYQWRRGTSLASQTTPEHVPAYSMNNLRRKTIDARNKLDVHRTLLDRYMPETFEADQDVGSAIMYKYGELVDR